MNVQTKQRTAALVPEWTKSDRLRKARESAGLEQGELAEMAGLSRTGVSNAETGRTEPRKSTVMLWALATGVSFEWLMTGEAPQETEEAPSGEGASDSRVRPKGFEPLAFWSVVPDTANELITLWATPVSCDNK